MLKFDVGLWTAAVLVEDISSPREMLMYVFKLSYSDVLCTYLYCLYHVNI